MFCSSHPLLLLEGPSHSHSLGLMLRVGLTRMDLAGVPVITEPWCWTPAAWPAQTGLGLVWKTRSHHTHITLTLLTHITSHRSYQSGHRGPGVSLHRRSNRLFIVAPPPQYEGSSDRIITRRSSHPLRHRSRLRSVPHHRTTL